MAVYLKAALGAVPPKLVITDPLGRKNGVPKVYTVDGTLRGQPLRGQNDDFEKSFRGTLRGHRGTLRGQNEILKKVFTEP